MTNSPAMSDHCRMTPIPKIRHPLKVFKTNRGFVYGNSSIESSSNHPISCMDELVQVLEIMKPKTMPTVWRSGYATATH